MQTIQEIERIEDAKASIKSSIESKGVTVPSSTKIDGYSTLIDSISGGGTTINNQDKTITTNGFYTADSGYTGLGTVTVNVPEPTGTIDITSNGTTNVKDYASASVNVQPNLQDKSVTITSNTTTTIEKDNGYNGLGTVSVTTNVAGDPSEYFNTTIKAGSDYGVPCGFIYAIKKFPKFTQVDGTSLENAFKYFQGEELDLSQLDTSNVTNFHSTFAQCANLTSAPQIDTSSGNMFNNMYGSCNKITTIPLTNTSSGTDFRYFVGYCEVLTSIPQFDTSSAIYVSDMFNTCRKLTNIPELDFGNVTQVARLVTNCNKLTNLGGFKDLGKAYLTTASANYSNYTLDINSASAHNYLTHDSLINIIDNLYDIATAGCNTQSLVLGATNLAKLSASEIQTGTDKGWSIS